MLKKLYLRHQTERLPNDGPAHVSRWEGQVAFRIFAGCVELPEFDGGHNKNGWDHYGNEVLRYKLHHNTQ